MKDFAISFTIGLLALVFLALFTPVPTLFAAEAGKGPAAAAVKECLGKAGSEECLDGLFREALKSHSTVEVLKWLQNAESEMRRECHPLAHAIGRETFRLKGNIHDSFAACDQTCHSGCFHGAVERFLRGDSAHAAHAGHVSQKEIAQKASAACDSKAPRRLYFQCLHGLGHAIMFFTRNQLYKSLEACDTLPDDWSRESCYGGVFMENVSSSTPDKRDVSASDYHYPCSRVDPKYRGACYLMQTWRMEEMGLDTERLFEECLKAAAYESQCTQSIGRDLSISVRQGDHRKVAEKCERPQGESRRACIRGVVYALIDHTWDGGHALPFCAALRDDTDVRYCNQTSRDYLTTFFEKQ